MEWMPLSLSLKFKHFRYYVMYKLHSEAHLIVMTQLECESNAIEKRSYYYETMATLNNHKNDMRLVADVVAIVVDSHSCVCVFFFIFGCYSNQIYMNWIVFGECSGASGAQVFVALCALNHYNCIICDGAKERQQPNWVRECVVLLFIFSIRSDCNGLIVCRFILSCGKIVTETAMLMRWI